MAICFGTGNVQRAYDLPAGMLAEGAVADLLVLDAPMSSAAPDALGAIARGDIPGIGALATDGVVRFVRSRNTAPAGRMSVLHEAREPARA